MRRGSNVVEGSTMAALRIVILLLLVAEMYTQVLSVFHMPYSSAFANCSPISLFFPKFRNFQTVNCQNSRFLYSTDSLQLQSVYVAGCVDNFQHCRAMRQEGYACIDEWVEYTMRGRSAARSRRARQVNMWTDCMRTCGRC